jgi:hypothetical protein
LAIVRPDPRTPARRDRTGDQDDVGAPRHAHAGQQRRREVGGTQAVLGVRRGELVGRRVGDQLPASRPAGAVHQDVDPAERIARCLGGSRAGTRIADVGPDGHGRATTRPQLLGDRLGGGGVPAIDDRDVGAVPHEAPRDPGADTPAATRDECRPPRERLHGRRAAFIRAAK